VTEVRRRWGNELGTKPPTRVTVTKVRDKFEGDGTMQGVNKGRCSIISKTERPSIRSTSLLAMTAAGGGRFEHM
jgi:hypothetical protein